MCSRSRVSVSVCPPAVILDTAGRSQADDALMAELCAVRDALSALSASTEVLLVMDAMTGQEAAGVASAFAERLGGVGGCVLSKLDGDARGGAALSVRAAAKCANPTTPTSPATRTHARRRREPENSGAPGRCFPPAGRPLSLSAWGSSPTPSSPSIPTAPPPASSARAPTPPPPSARARAHFAGDRRARSRTHARRAPHATNAARNAGMGDVVSLVERAARMNQRDVEKLGEKILKVPFPPR